jgi:hypothetical protein
MVLHFTTTSALLAASEVHTNFADESASLIANNIWNEEK